MRASERGCALVTGASRGIGAAVARSLAADGWPVGVHFRADGSEATALADDIRADGGRALAIGGDITAPDAPDRICSHLEQELERPIFVLVNNAAAIGDDLVIRMSDDSWQTVIDTNLSSAFRFCRRVLRPMLSNRFGRIVNIASAIAQRANPGQANYAASKAGLVALTKTLAVETASRSVTVNAIAPGIIDTPTSEGLAPSLREEVPARRAGTADEVAACASFLASERAAYVTGTVLTVDGGLTA